MYEIFTEVPNITLDRRHSLFKLATSPYLPLSTDNIPHFHKCVSILS